jgi:hypothetical protein
MACDSLLLFASSTAAVPLYHPAWQILLWLDTLKVDLCLGLFYHGVQWPRDLRLTLAKVTLEDRDLVLDATIARLEKAHSNIWLIDHDDHSF